jgi:hypothetical protein
MYLPFKNVKLYREEDFCRQKITNSALVAQSYSFLLEEK